jgi:proline iminopeptidase
MKRPGRLLVLLFLGSCAPTELPAEKSLSYVDFRTPGDYQAGGGRMVELQEGYRVWTKRFGNSPMKVLLLHGGPALTHEYMECFESFFPKAGIEFYEYDQLGSYYSDQPQDQSLWTLERFVEEVEQVRKTLGLGKDDFYLLGNSWGGLLAMEYALKYQEHLKGLIIANMTGDFARYAAHNAKLRAELPGEVLEKLQAAYHDLAYMEMVIQHYYKQHILIISSTSSGSRSGRSRSSARSSTSTSRSTSTCRGRANSFLGAS